MIEQCFSNIPAELANHNSWMNWYPKHNPNKSKPDKQPVETNYLQRTYPLSTCLKKMTDNPNFRLGFVFNPEKNGIIGIDLDNVIFNGDMTAEAMGYVNKANTWAEISGSGKGVHIYGYGTLPKNFRKKYALNQGNFEIYPWGRFFDFTANHIPTTPDVGVYPDLNTTFPFLGAKNKGSGSVGGYYEISDYYEVDKAIIVNLTDSLARAKNKATFLRLFNGKWEDNKKRYPTQSEADLGLMSCVMFFAKSEHFLKSYFGNLDDYDLKRLTFSVCHEVMRQSKLYRDKWEKRCDYRFNTLQFVFDSMQGIFNPKSYHSDMQRMNQSFSAAKRTLNNRQKIEDAIAELEATGVKVSFVNISKLSGLSRQHVSKIQKNIG